MSDNKVRESLIKLETALKRVGDALAEDSSNPLFIDGTNPKIRICL